MTKCPGLSWEDLENHLKGSTSASHPSFWNVRDVICRGRRRSSALWLQTQRSLRGILGHPIRLWIPLLHQAGSRASIPRSQGQSIQDFNPIRRDGQWDCTTFTAPQARPTRLVDPNIFSMPYVGLGGYTWPQKKIVRQAGPHVTACHVWSTRKQVTNRAQLALQDARYRRLIVVSDNPKRSA